ncbi:MAG: ABC transporter ATP-binding protein [Candidatus Sumerlaeia bacterium]|nr:ABC transporter ATP-binding protein [Candidatus Sumerlaeia bacterium]
MDSRSNAPAVECHRLTKGFDSSQGRIAVLQGIDLRVEPGELFMLVGPSGCGKTTLLSVLAGILRPDGGSCSVAGVEWSSLSPSALASRRASTIGFVFQQFNLLPALTAAENVAVPLFLQGVGRRERLRAAHALLEQVGLERYADARPTKLSGGQQQRVAIARALVHSPKLIVCDEPTSALDHETGTRVMDLLRDRGLRDGRTIVLVTHDSRIYPYADRIAFMDDGMIIDIKDSRNQPASTGASHA